MADEYQQDDEAFRIERKKIEFAVTSFRKEMELRLANLRLLKLEIERLRRTRGDLVALRNAENNATRTLKSLAASVRQVHLAAANAKFGAENNEHFLSEVRPYEEKVTAIAREFELLLSATDADSIRASTSYAASAVLQFKDDSPENDIVPSEELLSTTASTKEEEQAMLSRLDDLRRNAQAHDSLLQEISELTELMQTMAGMLNQQHEIVDDIAVKIEAAQIHINAGAKELQWASKLKAAAFPLSGAAVGCLVGGPAGFLAGLKVGGIVALAGGIAGAIGGTLLQKKIVLDSSHAEAQPHPETPVDTTPTLKQNGFSLRKKLFANDKKTR